jgi:hypothetical protein
MSDSNLQESTRWNEKVASLASHGLVGLMLTCVMITLVQFGQYLLPSWRGGYLPWATLVVSLEAMYTKREARRLSLFSPEWLVYRGVELVVLFLGLKIFLYLLSEPAQLWMDLAAWQDDFLGSFFSGEYLIAAALIFLFWLTSGQFAEDLEDLEGDEKLLDGVYPVNISAERNQIRRQLADRIMVYGAGMVILVSLMRIDLQSFLGFRPGVGSTVINVIAYFVLALALLSLTQLSVLRASWSTQRISLSLNLGSRWVIYSLIFLVGLAALAIFLPTSYSLGLLSILGLLLSWLIFAITLVGHLLLTLWFVFLSLFGGDQRVARPNPPLPPPTPPSPESGGLPTWFEIFRSILFWVIFLSVTGFSIYQFTRQHEALWNKLRQLPGMTILRKVWLWLQKGLRGANQVASAAIENSLARIRSGKRVVPLKEVRKIINLRRLPARQKVLFYYQAMVRRGDEYGISRRPAQTPQEYQETLQSSLPEIDRDLAAITAAFYEARYSQHEISEDQAGWVRQWWQRIQRTLRRWRKGSQG